MSLKEGTRVGPYEIGSLRGAGGMGEVYRARDTRLDRDAALKILPDSFAADADRLERFEREAKTLAALNHPHIAAIYGLEDGPADAGTEGRSRVLAMELVEGEDLSQILARGPLPLDEALPIARQIAEALEAAHAQGVVHRDLKPANIKVRADGTVKVLDFGLAKAMDQGSGIGDRGSGHLANSPTITSPAGMTRAGIILGTAAYMAPEQARGRVVDSRADVWAFGCVLFEMLTGKQAFDGEDITAVLAKVIEREPDWTLLPPRTPPIVTRLLHRALQKDRLKRLQHMGVARLDLDEALNGSVEETASQVAVPAVSTSRPEPARVMETPNTGTWLTWSADGRALMAGVAGGLRRFEVATGASLLQPGKWPLNIGGRIEISQGRFLLAGAAGAGPMTVEAQAGRERALALDATVEESEGPAQ
jgi:eukaryotic-like serine/threonine-protein kinase